MVWNLHPLFSECKESPGDFKQVLSERFDGHYDAKVIMVNLIHNYSLMVDAWMDLELFFSSDAKG